MEAESYVFTLVFGVLGVTGLVDVEVFEHFCEFDEQNGAVGAQVCLVKSGRAIDGD